MLEWMTLWNFRSWRNLPQLKLKPITLIFGANSSGKTALLDALLMLKQTTESNDRGRSICYSGYADLGSFREVIHNHDEGQRLAAALRWTTASDEPAVLREPTEGEPKGRIASQWFEYEAQWEQAEEVALARLVYRADRGTTIDIAREADGSYEPTVESDVGIATTRRRGRPLRNWPSPESCYAIPRQAAGDWPNADWLEFNHQFELLMQRVRYVGPLRNYPQRAYPWTGEAPKEIAKDGAGAIEALLADARGGPIPSKRRSRRPKDVLDWTARWLAKFGLAEQFEVARIGPGQRYYEVRVRVPETGTQTMLPDVGFGVSQLLPVIIQLLFVPEHSILLFEQPEIHLHPGAAATLADLFLDVAYRRKLQLVVETHSEYLLTRLQRRVAEAEQPYASPDHLALYFCKLQGGESTVAPVRMNVLGEIENWPPGFFGDAIGDLHAMTQAAARHRMAGEQG